MSRFTHFLGVNLISFWKCACVKNWQIWCLIFTNHISHLHQSYFQSNAVQSSDVSSVFLASAATAGKQPFVSIHLLTQQSQSTLLYFRITIHFSYTLESQYILAPGKHRVSTPISRARVICPRASFVPENLWEEIPRARHLVNDARICGTNFWRDMTRASKLPHFWIFAHQSGPSE